MSEEIYVMAYPTGGWVAIDQSSGGYPYKVTKLASASRWSTPIEALTYRKHWWDEGWTLHRLEMTTVPVLVTPAMEAEAKGDKEFKEFQRLAKKFGITGTGECPFNRAWAGRCKAAPEVGEIYCPEHAKMKCYKCGAQATSDCSHAGQFVCGVPQCSEHSHHG